MKQIPFIVAMALAVSSTSVDGAEPVAIIEEAGPGAPVTLFSYLTEGQIIELGATAEVLIAYLRSCVQERVLGGVVTIGRERSQVVGGRRSTNVLDCGNPQAALSPAEAERAAVLVMRKPTPPAPQLLLTSTSPFIAPRSPATLVRLNRLDRNEPVLTLALNGGVADLAAAGETLDRGATYRVEAGAASIVVKIAENAQRGDGPILLRLLSF